MDDENKIFSLVKGGKPEATDEQKLPQNVYCLIDTDGEEFYGKGFLIFTTHHIAVMRETEAGAIPVLLMPLANLRAAEIVESEDTDD